VINRISAKKKCGAAGVRTLGIAPAEIPRILIFFETKKTASLYRAKNSAYLMLHVLIANEGSEAIVVRAMKATMGNEKGVMLCEKFIAQASYLGRRSSHSLGSSENLLPLSIAGGAQKDAYLCFEFFDADVEIGAVGLEAATSKGMLAAPLEVDVVG